MSEVALLPRVLVHRTPFGTRIEWRKGLGLSACDATGRRRRLAPEELRRCYPEAWPAWVRWAALLPAGEAARHPHGPRDGGVNRDEQAQGARSSSSTPSARASLPSAATLPGFRPVSISER